MPCKAYIMLYSPPTCHIWHTQEGCKVRLEYSHYSIGERGYGEYEKNKNTETAAIRTAIPTVVIAGRYETISGILTRSAVVVLFFCLVV